jgi:hypothetical protein
MPSSKWLVFIRPSLAGFDRPLTNAVGLGGSNLILDVLSNCHSVRQKPGSGFNGVFKISKRSGFVATSILPAAETGFQSGGKNVENSYHFAIKIGTFIKR